MHIEHLLVRELPNELIARWNEIARGAPELASPYLRPEFAQAVAAVRPNVEVGILHDGATVSGFFPFERVGGCVARPVGGRLSDYQAVIAPAEALWNVKDLLRGCRLRGWEFDHHIAAQRQLAPYVSSLSNSWRIDLSTGFDAFVAGRKAAGAGALGEMLRKSRKLHREHDVRFAWHVTDEVVFDQLLAWKSEQYRRSELTDLFRFPWIVALLKDIWRKRDPRFAGVLSALFVNNQPAAIHFGMQSGTLLHSWFPAYDYSLGKYSPGSALLLCLLQHAAEHGVAMVDLGKGDDEYKLTFANNALPLAEGIIETRPIAAALRRGWQATRDWVRDSSFREYSRRPVRWLRQMREWVALR